MTEIDPSQILLDKDCIYFRGVKYQKVEPPKSFYDKLWEELGKKVGYGIDCDQLTDRVMDLIKDNLPEPKEEFQPTPQTPEQVAEGLRDAMKQAKKDGVFDIEKFNSRPPSLWNVMRHQLGFSIDICDEIVDAVEEWMPKEHDTNSYEWNKCVRMLREKLWEQSE